MNGFYSLLQMQRNDNYSKKVKPTEENQYIEENG